MKSNYFNKKLLPNFKTLGLLFLTVLLFSACDDDPSLPPEKKPAENLTFQKITVPFSSDKIKATDILAKIQGEKGGYTLKEIKDITPKNVLTITGKAPNFIITINKAGTVTATIVLQHKNKKDATITKATIEITKATAENLTFQKVRKAFISGGSFATADILAGVQGTKTGYTLKSITALNPTGVASVQGSAPSISLTMGKVGVFTANLTLQHHSKEDASITGARFEITKPAAPTLTFTKRTKPFSSSGSFTTADILAGVQGNKTGYTVKNITNLNPANLVTVTPAKALNFNGSAGSFTATIILGHAVKADATINNAEFEITKLTAESLTFNKRTKTFTSGGKFTTADILAGVQGNKTGYTLKNITNLSSSNIVTVSSSKTLDFSGRAGNFTATIVLQHNTKADATIANCAFEIRRGTAERLAFTRLTKQFISGGSFTTTEILNHIQGTKLGYTLKNITNLKPNNLVTVSPSKALNFSGRIGSFTATITLQHLAKADATITGAEFEVTSLPVENLTFRKITKAFASGGKFTTADILAGVQGNKTGYTIKNITNLNPRNLVTFSSSKTLNFSGRVGDFTATIILEHSTKADATITGAQFEITKATAESFTFNKRTKTFATGGKFTTADILAGVRGDKTGYTIKNITNLNPSNLVTVSSSKTLDFSGRAGSFTATIILQHSTKADATITGAQFEIRKTTAESLRFNKRTKTFATGGKFTTADILGGVQGTKNGLYR